MKLSSRFFSRGAVRVPRIEINSVKTKSYGSESEVDESYEMLFRQAREAQLFLNRVLGELRRQSAVEIRRTSDLITCEQSFAFASSHGDEATVERQTVRFGSSPCISDALTSCRSMSPSPARRRSTSSNVEVPPSSDEGVTFIELDAIDSSNRGKKIRLTRNLAACLMDKVSPKLGKDKKKSNCEKSSENIHAQTLIARTMGRPDLVAQ